MWNETTLVVFGGASLVDEKGFRSALGFLAEAVVSSDASAMEVALTLRRLPVGNAAAFFRCRNPVGSGVASGEAAGSLG